MRMDPPELPGDDGPPEHAWTGTERYEVLRVIGRGGMGVVYEAFDRARNQRVALKTLLRFSPAALYQFKQEFRALADVPHPNLVRLYELVAIDAARPFFAMELVSGEDFLDHVCGGQTPPADHAPRVRPGDSRAEDATWPDRPPGGSQPAIAPAKRTSTPADLVRLRRALPQLVQGIHALHLVGKLHRDIKPSNVLVTADGRVVLLDFGIATQIAPAFDDNLAEAAQAGTPRYMAPEQTSDEAPLPASDWYSVGVMLYEALVGSAPFVGNAFEVLSNKVMLDARRPSEIVDGVPDDLDELCHELLERDPEKRPGARQILRRLGVGLSVAPTPLPVYPAGAVATALVGRQEHLAALRSAFEATRAGRSVTLFVGGAPGMGKSTLVQHFLDQLVANHEAVTLRGRAYERESVPYKAVDTLIDALSRYLLRLADRDDGVTLPADVWALARLFPVLGRVPAIGAMPEQPVVELLRVRRQAFTALRELVGSLARRRPLVLYADDVQWGDPDSAALLLELVRPPDPPPILLVMTYRDEEARTSPFFAEIERWPASVERRELAVGPLGFDDARGFALTLLSSAGSAGERAPALAEVVARESRGSPFLVEELARTIGVEGVANPSLEQIVDGRLARLTPEARRLLEVLAVAGRPLPVTLAGDAAGVYDAVDETVWLLRERRFVRLGFRDGRELAEIAHDRVRETLVALMPAPKVAEHHGRLARVLGSSPGADPEALAVHLLGAGERAGAAQYAELAAEQAVQKLAFDQAIRLFRLAIQTGEALSADVRRLRLRLATVLEWAGRGGESAAAYLEAAEGAPPIERLDIERAAAEQLLTSGRIADGVQILNRVLEAAGMRPPPRSTMGAVFWLIVYRLWLRVRGLSFRERDPDDVRREDRARIDALYAVAVGMSLVDVVIGACMQARHLSFALRAGDRLQIIRAVCIEATHLASAGGAASKREKRLFEIGQDLAERSNNREALGFALGGRGIGMFVRGQWKEALDLFDAAYSKYPNHRAGWHANAYLFSLYALVNTGDLNELRLRQARLLADSWHRGDLYTTVNLRTTTASLMLLAADQPAVARAKMHEAMASWPNRGFLLQHWQALAWETEISLYEGDAASPYEAHVRAERPLKGSRLLHVQFIRALNAFCRARCAIGSIDSTPDARDARLAEARKLARALERERMPWTSVLAALVVAAAANAAGDRQGASRALRAAISGADRQGMAFHAAVARYRQGALSGDDAEGRAMREQSRSALRAWGVVAPERMVRMLLPGAWPSDSDQVLPRAP